MQNDTSNTSHVQSIYTPSTSKINSEINSRNTSVVIESTSQISHTYKSTSSLSHTHFSVTKTKDKQKVLGFDESPVFKNITNNVSQRSFGVQVLQKLVNPHIRSKFTMCMPSTTDESCQSQVEVVNRMCSPIKSLLKTSVAANSNTSSSAIVSCSTNSSSEYQNSSSHSEYKYSSSCSEERKKK